ncbi:MAG TPA: GPW/gp25 family protein [Novosphingobium sp.]|nr:GPW/gp25 family protein [Novosphingobium sp.]
MTSPFGKSLAFPPRVGASGRMMWSEGEDNIRESIAVILRTMQRERVQLPDFGANLGAYLFEPNDAGTHARIARDVELALARWEPRIALEDVVVTADPAGPQNAHAAITYRLVATGIAESIALSVPLGAQ